MGRSEKKGKVLTPDLLEKEYTLKALGQACLSINCWEWTHWDTKIIKLSFTPLPFFNCEINKGQIVASTAVLLSAFHLSKIIGKNRIHMLKCNFTAICITSCEFSTVACFGILFYVLSIP